MLNSIYSTVHYQYKTNVHYVTMSMCVDSTEKEVA